MSAPYRALHLIHSDQRRGAEVFAAQLAYSIEGNGKFKNGICALHQGNGDGLSVPDLTMFRLEGQVRFFDRLALDPRLLFRLWGVLQKFRPDVVVAHGSDTLKYGACAMLAYPSAATVYRNIGTASVWANSAVKVNVNRMFLSRMDAVVSVSESTRRDFINTYRLPESRVIFIPNGVSTDEFDAGRDGRIRAQVRQELGLLDLDVVLIAVGNLSPEKGHGELLTMISGLCGAGLRNHLIIIGEGPLRRRLEEQSKQLDLSSRVHFLGRRSDVPRLLAAADIFVLPSKTEGMPAVLIEAGLAGLPSVAFEVGGVAEVVEHGATGLLAAPGDLAGFMKSLAVVSRDLTLGAAMGDAARQRCRHFFDIRKVAGKYEDVFLKLLKASPRGTNGQT